MGVLIRMTRDNDLLVYYSVAVIVIADARKKFSSFGAVGSSDEDLKFIYLKGFRGCALTIEIVLIFYPFKSCLFLKLLLEVDVCIVFLLHQFSLW